MTIPVNSGRRFQNRSRLNLSTRKTAVLRRRMQVAKAAVEQDAVQARVFRGHPWDGQVPGCHLLVPECRHHRGCHLRPWASAPALSAADRQFPGHRQRAAQLSLRLTNRQPLRPIAPHLQYVWLVSNRWSRPRPVAVNWNPAGTNAPQAPNPRKLKHPTVAAEKTANGLRGRPYHWRSPDSSVAAITS